MAGQLLLMNPTNTLNIGAFEHQQGDLAELGLPAAGWVSANIVPEPPALLTPGGAADAKFVPCRLVGGLECH